MTEINNNINSYGYKAERLEGKKDISNKPQEALEKGIEEHQYVPDTGVLGRSQVQVRGIDKSVEEAVKLAQNAPNKLKGSVKMSDHMYDEGIKSGKSSSDAYRDALFAAEEFEDIAPNK